VQTVQIAAIVLAGIGALNWGLVGFFKFDLVAAVTGQSFGKTNLASRVVYALVAVAGVVAFTAIASLTD
jgi:uncharacterized membrane protein YuzA (DUF378 family)